MPFLSAIVECPKCGTEFYGVWAVKGDIQDLAEAPVAPKYCPNPKCGHTWELEYPGWSFMTEAG
jgi:hypothetical protein